MERLIRQNPYSRPRRRHAYRTVWACMAVLALIEVLIVVFMP